jgi:hypothetical protein
MVERSSLANSGERANLSGIANSKVLPDLLSDEENLVDDERETERT